VRGRRARCPKCGSAVPKAARFCAECGTRLGDDSEAEVLEDTAESVPAPVSFTTAEPRLFGVTPPMAVFALGIAALAVAVFLLATTRWLPGALTLAAAVLLLAAFAEVARRKPSGVVARASVSALSRLRARAGYTVDAFATRSRAARELARAQQELTELGSERERGLRALGETVYGKDRAGTKRLREELAELDARIERKEAEMATIAAQARERIESGRLEVQRTAMVEIPEEPQPPRTDPIPDPQIPAPDPGPPTPTPVPEPSPTPVPEPYPPPDEATPPAPARIPEPGPLDERRAEN
jgi:hypothetical protein